MTLGDIVQVTDKKSHWKGCVLDYLGRDALGWDLCYRGPSFPYVIRCRGVEFFRRPEATPEVVEFWERLAREAKQAGVV